MLQLQFGTWNEEVRSSQFCSPSKNVTFIKEIGFSTLVITSHIPDRYSVEIYCIQVRGFSDLQILLVIRRRSFDSIGHP